MLMAQLRGKLPTEVWLGSEDLLTSAVFGTLKNLSPSVTAALLSRVQPLKGSTAPTVSGPLAWHFWPWWNVCEPDVVIEDGETLCVIEAKLYSEFSEDAATGSQLRREWLDGLRVSREKGKELWLVAVTNHAVIPADAIRRQLMKSGADPSRVGWLSWLEIGRLLRELGDELGGGWCEDLLGLLTRMGLAPFDGFGEAVGAALRTPTRLPWTDRVLLGEDRPKMLGFGRVADLVRGLTVSSEISWKFVPAPGVEFIGIGPTISAIREWRRKGGTQWRFKLT